MAFVAAEAVLTHWADPEFESQIAQRGELIRQHLLNFRDKSNSDWDVRGRGMIWGLDVRDGKVAKQIIKKCFQNGLLIESSGAHDEVLKVMTALTIDVQTLRQGLQTLERAIDAVLTGSKPATPIAPVAVPSMMTLPINSVQ